MNDEIESLLNGSLDLHVHSGPDTKNMRMDAMETARSAYEAGMAGFVLKSNDYLTTPLTYTLSQNLSWSSNVRVHFIKFCRGRHKS